MTDTTSTDAPLDYSESQAHAIMNGCTTGTMAPDS